MNNFFFVNRDFTNDIQIYTKNDKSFLGNRLVPVRSSPFFSILLNGPAIRKIKVWKVGREYTSICH